MVGEGERVEGLGNEQGRLDTSDQSKRSTKATNRACAPHLLAQRLITFLNLSPFIVRLCMIISRKFLGHAVLISGTFFM